MKNKMLNDQTTSAAIYKQLFTDAEWDAISSALNDYQDYGDEEANIADSIQAKIATIYKLTNWNYDEQQNDFPLCTFCTWRKIWCHLSWC